MNITEELLILDKFYLKLNSTLGSPSIAKEIGVIPTRGSGPKKKRERRNGMFFAITSSSLTTKKAQI